MGLRYAGDWDKFLQKAVHETRPLISPGKMFKSCQALHRSSVALR